ncbi:MAG TPA: protein-glutamate O-methyltransferase CheR [Thermoanaerobaculia bacterium]|nr:protein-glutamate O-methyltransferase CheR [Thermoanaerobaculia bacterium]
MRVAAAALPESSLDAIERIRPLSEREFALFQALILREAGIYLAPAKKALLVGRLSKRLRALNLSSFGEYYRRIVDEDDREERVQMLDCVSTNETHFFREPRQFEFLERQVIPVWKERGPRLLRLWSAGCSTGEEPYSLAMLLLHHFPPGSGREIEILATDLSTRVLARAEAGVWPVDRAKEIPLAYRRAFMLRGTASQEGRMKAGPEIRDLVRFERLNLNEERYPVRGPFHLIFCRNVLIYFQLETKLKVIHRLLDVLAPDGLLFLGHAESLNAVTDRVATVVPTVYTHAKAKAASLAPSAPAGRTA